MYILIVVGGLAVIVFVTLISAMSRYKRCPSDRVLVIFGKVGKDKTSKCVHGGAAFVWPLIQNYKFLSLQPLTIDIRLDGALSKQNIRVNIPSRFTIGISTNPAVMNTAAERMLSMDRNQIEENAKDIIFGQLRATIATMDIEEINADRENFEKKVMNNVESELKKIGLMLINVNITDITDESGYIEALGKKAASEASNRAKVEVAKQDRDGDVGEAQANQDKRVKVSEANAKAVEGENNAKVTVAASESDMRIKQSEAKKLAVSAELINAAEAEKSAYEAQKAAELARAQKEEATRKADIIVPAEIAKEKVTLEAEAAAEKLRQEGKGEGDNIREKLKGEADGIKEILTKQAEGFKLIMEAADNNADAAVKLMVADKLPEIIKIQVQALNGIQIDKIVVWDQGGSNGDGSTTANWLSNFIKSVPALSDAFELAGMQLPEILGKSLDGNKVNNSPKEEAVVVDSEESTKEEKKTKSE